MNQQRTLARYLDSLPNRKIDETVHVRLINPSCSVALDDGGIRRRRLLKKKTVSSKKGLEKLKGRRHEEANVLAVSNDNVTWR